MVYASLRKTFPTGQGLPESIALHTFLSIDIASAADCPLSLALAVPAPHRVLGIQISTTYVPHTLRPYGAKTTRPDRIAFSFKHLPLQSQTHDVHHRRTHISSPRTSHRNPVSSLPFRYPPYLPPSMFPLCAIAAFCSWNLCPNLSDPLRNLSTQRMTQPSSFDDRERDVKSSTQCSKHFCTRLEYICDDAGLVGAERDGSRDRRAGGLRDGGMEERGRELGCHRTFMNWLICFFSMRDCSSRCSLAERLGLCQLCQVSTPDVYSRVHSDCRVLW